ncbi:MAG: hypothetical protein H7338_10300, partial [Candidatus Sericytochromatia bacterium]|nr:hypothetical protein [Candidatus Sericytochromatia bacterium]
MALSALTGVRLQGVQVPVSQGRPAPATTPAMPLVVGDTFRARPVQGGLSEALKVKLAGNVPGATFQFEGHHDPVDPTALRQAAIVGRKPLGVSHDVALAAKRAALVTLQGAQGGSNVANLATTSLAVIDGAGSITAFRRTEYADTILDIVAMAADAQFLTAISGNPNAMSARTMARGIMDTRNTNAGEEATLNGIVVAQVKRLASPGSYVAGLIDANQQLIRTLTTELDRTQLTDLALKDVAVAPDADFALGNDARIVRALARQVTRVLSANDTARVLLQSTALRQITRMVPLTARVAAVANEALSRVAAAPSLGAQDAALKYALDSIQAAADGDF